MKSVQGNIQDIQKLAKAAQAPAVAAPPPAVVGEDTWGATEDLEGTDLLIPKIHHMQAISKLVQEGVARPGDWCDSLTNKILAKKDDKLEVIVFGMFKTMIISKLDPSSGKFKLDEIVQLTPQNAAQYANAPFIEETQFGKYKNNLQYNYYCLIPGSADDLPYVLPLTSTKIKSARKLNTMLSKLAQLKRPSAAVVFELRSTAEKNDQGQWMGVEITQGRNATEEEIARAKAWYLKSRTQKFVAAEPSEDSHDDFGVNV